MSIERLRELNSRAPELGDVGVWLSERLGVYLDAQGDMSLDEALQVKPAQGQLPWWTRESKANRDVLIKHLAAPYRNLPIRKQARMGDRQAKPLPPKPLAPGLRAAPQLRGPGKPRLEVCASRPSSI